VNGAVPTGRQRPYQLALDTGVCVADKRGFDSRYPALVASGLILPESTRVASNFSSFVRIVFLALFCRARATRRAGVRTRLRMRRFGPFYYFPIRGLQRVERLDGYYPPRHRFVYLIASRGHGAFADVFAGVAYRAFWRGACAGGLSAMFTCLT